MNIGDKVIARAFTGGPYKIGKIIKITPKRKDIIVDFGNYTETYKKSGYSKYTNIYSTRHIELLTTEIEKELQDLQLINQCKSTFAKTNLSADQARKILEILKA